MIPVAEALARTLALAGPPQPEEIDAADALGRVLLAPATARLTQPPFDSAAMDGYAIRATDAPGPLRVIGEAAAGRAFDGEAAPGTTIRIFTGAPVPQGYDRVVMQEDAQRDGDGLTVPSDGPSHIRPRGQDFAQGLAFQPPRRLTASDLGLLAAMNVARVTVARRPSVAILPGGDELVPPGSDPAPDQIVSSNDIALAALVTAAGGIPRRLPIAPDTEADLRRSLADAATSDLVVTIGGASVGDHDLIGRVTEAMGVEQAFWKIAMRPGKPLAAGRLGTALFLGLPGNPVSSVVCGMVFVQPLLAKMQGLDPAADPPARARLARDLPPEGPRQHYLRARLTPGDDLPRADPFHDQDSARLALLAEADALVIRPAHDGPRKAGDIVEILPLR